MFRFEEENIEVLEENTILKVLAGSTSQGLATNNSDQDEKSVVKLPPKYIYRLEEEWQTSTFHNPDREFHSVKKFLTLANKQNPTILEMFFADNQFILHEDKYGKMLRDHRHIFLTNNCYNSFGGYARRNLLDIKYGLNQNNEEGLDEYLLLKLEELLGTFSERFGNYFNQVQVSKVSLGNDGLELLVDVDFKNADINQVNAIVSEVHNAYKNISKTKQANKKVSAKALLKHAMHLIRLLIMGIEVLQNGDIQVYRTKDREFLLDIRNGKYTWKEIFELVEQLFKELEVAYQKSILPRETNFNEINKLYFEIMTA